MPIFDNLLSNLQQMTASSGFDLSIVQNDLMAFLNTLEQHAASNPEPIFAILRRLHPVLLVKNVALVTLYADVQDVLIQEQVFGVTYGPKMRIVTGGPDFFLGMPNSPAYERDTAHMRSVARRSDVQDIVVPYVSAASQAIVKAGNGHLELISQLTKPVAAGMITTYFGCPPDSIADLAEWTSTLFQYLFTDLKNDPALDVAARAASAHVRDYLDRNIARQKANPTADDTVLNRCLALQKTGFPGMDDIGIRDNLLGLLIGAIPTTSKCCAQALDELFKRPDMLATAQQAAMANDDATFARYIFEALRFNPNNPGVFRVALEDYVVGKGTLHATKIPAGTQVLAATQSAMFDESVVQSPEDFRVDRPAYNYIFWGLGLHTCFGQYINEVQIPGILKPLLQRRDLKRATGPAGQLTMTGPFPSSLSVEYSPA